MQKSQRGSGGSATRIPNRSRGIILGGSKPKGHIVRSLEMKTPGEGRGRVGTILLGKSGRHNFGGIIILGKKGGNSPKGETSASEKS